MADDIDFQSPLGQVRLLIADTSTDPAKRLLNDDHLEGFLTMAGQRVRLAAAQALDAIATSEVLVSKKIRTQDLATDGPAVAAELRAQAERLRGAERDEDGDDIFDVVDTMNTTGRPELTERPFSTQFWGL